MGLERRGRGGEGRVADAALNVPNAAVGDELAEAVVLTLVTQLTITEIISRARYIVLDLEY